MRHSPAQCSSLPPLPNYTRGNAANDRILLGYIFRHHRTRSHDYTVRDPSACCHNTVSAQPNIITNHNVCFFPLLPHHWLPFRRTVVSSEETYAGPHQNILTKYYPRFLASPDATIVINV